MNISLIIPEGYPKDDILDAFFVCFLIVNKYYVAFVIMRWSLLVLKLV